MFVAIGNIKAPRRGAMFVTVRVINFVFNPNIPPKKKSLKAASASLCFVAGWRT